MAYELYRLAGNPACLTEHVRVWMDGRLMGYQLLIEQPNKGFLTRNKRDSSRYLYKVTYMAQGLREIRNENLAPDWLSRFSHPAAIVPAVVLN